MEQSKLRLHTVDPAPVRWRPAGTSWKARQKLWGKQDLGSGEANGWSVVARGRHLGPYGPEPRGGARRCRLHPWQWLLKSPRFHVESGLDRLVAVAVWGQWFSVLTVGSAKSINRQLPAVVLSGVLVSPTYSQVQGSLGKGLFPGSEGPPDPGR